MQNSEIYRKQSTTLTTYIQNSSFVVELYIIIFFFFSLNKWRYLKVRINGTEKTQNIYICIIIHNFYSSHSKITLHFLTHPQNINIK